MKKLYIYCFFYLFCITQASAGHLTIDDNFANGLRVTGRINHDFGNASGTFSGGIPDSTDWFTFDATAGDVIDFEITSADFDSVIALFQETANGIVETRDHIGTDLTLLALDDDGGIGLLSLILNFNITTTGQYALGIQEFGLNDNGSRYDVSLVITPATLATIPEPTSLWLIASALIGLMGVRRKRRRKGLFYGLV